MSLRHPWLEAVAPQWIEHQSLLQALGVAALLKLASRLETRLSLERVFDFVDIHMARDPRSTADALVRTGWWTAWRKMSRLMAGESEEKRWAAEAWLTSRSWTGKEATREDWNQVMADLPTSHYEAGRAAPWSCGGEAHRLGPWIPPFEEEQIVDLAERAPDLPSLAGFADALEKESSRPDLGQPIYRFVLRSSRFQHYFQHEDVLGWLLDNPRAGLLPLSLVDSLQLWQRAGSRVERALQARLASVRQCLDKDQQAKEAILGADEPNLWGTSGFAEALAFWMHGRGSGERIGWDIAEKIERQIAAEPLRRPKPVNHQLVRDLMGRKLEHCASLLDPDLPGEVAQENLIESVIDALTAGTHNHSCWQMLAAAIERGSTGRHLLSLVAERIRSATSERRAALVRTGWSTFEAASHWQTWLTHIRPDQTDLPVFDLAASLSEPGGLGTAALRVIFAANPSQRSKLEWWEALLGGLFGWRRFTPLDCPEDRSDVAIALVVRLLDDLEPQERQLFWNALERRAGNKSGWELLVGAQ